MSLVHPRRLEAFSPVFKYSATTLNPGILIWQTKRELGVRGALSRRGRVSLPPHERGFQCFRDGESVRHCGIGEISYLSI